MRVAVQAWLPSSEPSGARTRLRGLLQGLARIPDANRFELLVLTSERQPDPELLAVASALPHARVLPVPIPPGPTWRRALAEARVLPGLLAHERIDVLDIASLPLPRVVCPVVLTLHDLRDIGPHARRLRRLLAPAVLASALGRATRVIVPSPPVAVELTARHPSAGARIDVVPAGIFAPCAAPPTELACFLHIGRPEPRKALPFLLHAWALACQQEPGLPPLVLAGPGPPRQWQRLSALAARLGIDGRIRLPGLLPDAALQRELASAIALLCPSYLEGFGLPVLEAMAVGVPVLVQEGGVPAWLAGMGGLALPPAPAAWAAAIHRVFHDAALRASLATAARARAREFSPAAAAAAWTRSLLAAHTGAERVARADG